MTAPARARLSSTTATVLAQARRHRAQVEAARFTVPRCAQCDRTLTTRNGQPSWEILEGRFICYEVCFGPLPVRR